MEKKNLVEQIENLGTETASRREHIHALINAGYVVTEKGHDVVISYNGENLGTLAKYRKGLKPTTASGKTTNRKPATKKQTSRNQPRNFNTLVLSIVRGEIKPETIDVDTPAASVTALNSILSSGLYNAAKSYLLPALDAAKREHKNALDTRDFYNRAKETASRFIDFELWQKETSDRAAAYNAQNVILSAISDETARAATIKALQTAGTYIDAPAPFYRPICGGLMAANSQPATETSETAEKIATAKPKKERGKKTA